jgi:hypothetical protein
MPKKHVEAVQVKRVVKGKVFMQRVTDESGYEEFVRREPGETVEVDEDTAAALPDRLILQEQVAAEEAVAAAKEQAEVAAEAAANAGKTE